MSTSLFAKEEKKIEVKKMFDSIASRYDLLNRVLSAGVDKYWRKKALKLSKLDSNSILLDMACGTGDVAIQARKYGVTQIFGADFSYNMLSLFNKKVDWINKKNFQTAAEFIPLKADSVTNVTVAFGVRNFYDIPLAFREFNRIIKKGGRATVLEFAMPKNSFFKAVYKFYFKNVLPLVGKIVSGHPMAYDYLPDSVEDFDKNVDLVKLFKEAGFSKVDRHLFTFGIVQVVIATN